MINYNGAFLESGVPHLPIDNRGFKFGDALFETLKIVNGNILFWEDHYFRLMASMRILRMDIPMAFTMDFLQSEIIKTLAINNLKNKPVRVRLNVCREDGDYYMPNIDSKISYSINTSQLIQSEYVINTNCSYIVDLYTDYHISNNLISGLKTNNKIIQVTGSIYAKENNLDNCLVLNTNKKVIEALNGNLFLVRDNQIKTPPLEDGCIRGVMRKQVLQLLANKVNFTVEETSISPFELQKADELFITNVIQGVVPISKYRKKQYSNKLSKQLISEINLKLI